MTPPGHPRIAIDAHTCFGKPRIKDTRIWVELIVSAYAHGRSEAELLEDWPHLVTEDLRAALAYAAELALLTDVEPLRAARIAERESWFEGPEWTVHERRSPIAAE